MNMVNRFQLLCTSLVFAMVSSAIARACLQATLCLLYLSIHLVHRPFSVRYINHFIPSSSAIYMPIIVLHMLPHHCRSACVGMRVSVYGLWVYVMGYMV